MAAYRAPGQTSAPCLRLQGGCGASACKAKPWDVPKEPHMAELAHCCFYKLGLLFVGVLRALYYLGSVCIRAADGWKLPNVLQVVLRILISFEAPYWNLLVACPGC